VVGAATDTSANALPAARIVKNFVMDFSCVHGDNELHGVAFPCRNKLMVKPA
jgi:hypothetical protein